MVFAPFGRAVRGNVQAARAPLGGVTVRPELPVPQRLPALPESLERPGGFHPQVMELCDSGYQQTNMTIMGKNQHATSSNWRYEVVVSNNTYSFNYHTWGFMIQIDTSRYLEVGIGKQSSFCWIHHTLGHPGKGVRITSYTR